MRLIIFLAPIILMIVKLIIMKFKQLIENEKRGIRKRTDREMN